MLTRSPFLPTSPQPSAHWKQSTVLVLKVCIVALPKYCSNTMQTFELVLGHRTFPRQVRCKPRSWRRKLCEMLQHSNRLQVMGAWSIPSHCGCLININALIAAFYTISASPTPQMLDQFLPANRYFLYNRCFVNSSTLQMLGQLLHATGVSSISSYTLRVLHKFLLLRVLGQFPHATVIWSVSIYTSDSASLFVQ